MWWARRPGQLTNAGTRVPSLVELALVAAERLVAAQRRRRRDVADVRVVPAGCPSVVGSEDHQRVVALTRLIEGPDQVPDLRVKLRHERREPPARLILDRVLIEFGIRVERLVFRRRINRDMHRLQRHVDEPGGSSRLDPFYGLSGLELGRIPFLVERPVVAVPRLFVGSRPVAVRPRIHGAGDGSVTVVEPVVIRPPLLARTQMPLAGDVCGVAGRLQR